MQPVAGKRQKKKTDSARWTGSKQPNDADIKKEEQVAGS